jgi:hypothetical protein
MRLTLKDCSQEHPEMGHIQKEVGQSQLALHPTLRETKPFHPE